jgi:hypothetical protein
MTTSTTTSNQNTTGTCRKAIERLRELLNPGPFLPLPASDDPPHDLADVLKICDLVGLDARLLKPWDQVADYFHWNTQHVREGHGLTVFNLIAEWVDKTLLAAGGYVTLPNGDTILRTESLPWTLLAPSHGSIGPRLVAVFRHALSQGHPLLTAPPADQCLFMDGSRVLILGTALAAYRMDGADAWRGPLWVSARDVAKLTAQHEETRTEPIRKREESERLEGERLAEAWKRRPIDGTEAAGIREKLAALTK